MTVPRLLIDFNSGEYSSFVLEELTFNPLYKGKYSSFIAVSADSYPVYKQKTISKMFGHQLLNV